MKTKVLCLLGVVIASAVCAEEAAKPSEPHHQGEEAPVYAPNDVDEDGGSGDVDPFAAPSGGGYSSLKRLPSARLGEKRQSLRVRVEVWEVGTRDLALALDGFDGPLAVESWRRERLKDEKSRLVHAPVAVLEEKSVTGTESIVEEIYPTEYEPPEILPDKVVKEIRDEKMPETLNELISSVLVGASPTSFETRNTGFTFEAGVQPVTGEKGCWDVSLSIEDVIFVRMKGFEPEALQVEMPVFANFSTGGLHRVQESRWQMVSATARPGGTEEKNVGLSWVTLVRVDPAR